MTMIDSRSTNSDSTSPAELARPGDGPVSRKVFRGPEIYGQELRRTFTQTWLYTGHGACTNLVARSQMRPATCLVDWVRNRKWRRFRSHTSTLHWLDVGERFGHDDQYRPAVSC